MFTESSLNMSQAVEIEDTPPHRRSISLLASPQHVVRLTSTTNDRQEQRPSATAIEADCWPHRKAARH